MVSYGAVVANMNSTPKMWPLVTDKTWCSTIATLHSLKQTAGTLKLVVWGRCFSFSSFLGGTIFRFQPLAFSGGFFTVRFNGNSKGCLLRHCSWQTAGAEQPPLAAVSLMDLIWSRHSRLPFSDGILSDVFQTVSVMGYVKLRCVTWG